MILGRLTSAILGHVASAITGSDNEQADPTSGHGRFGDSGGIRQKDPYQVNSMSQGDQEHHKFIQEQPGYLEAKKLSLLGALKYKPKTNSEELLSSAIKENEELVRQQLGILETKKLALLGALNYQPSETDSGEGADEPDTTEDLPSQPQVKSTGDKEKLTADSSKNDPESHRAQRSPLGATEGHLAQRSPPGATEGHLAQRSPSGATERHLAHRGITPSIDRIIQPSRPPSSGPDDTAADHERRLDFSFTQSSRELVQHFYLAEAESSISHP
ncbi:hypothetical protein QAD02_008450 [Eretmocerus hayati]|uniref:Uncharacterized protein n=1 Tax=Eretmocerus hayati TaxID=131215 RepID=A0ACC2N6I6_9HYME|nr:hypothetical protein QAD02_008450 [Eretmocerus hayati]